MVDAQTITPHDAELLEVPPGYYVEPGTGAWLTLPWPATRDEQIALARSSLGPGMIAWCERWLVHHLDGNGWRFTNAQKRFLVLWYAIRPDGKWRYRSGVMRRAKGVGKDPFGAAFVLAELAGPVVPDGFNAAGQAVGRAHRMSLVQIAANSEAQAADMLRVANAMAGRDFREQYDYDAGVLRSQLPSGSRIELLTNSERSSEGDPATFGVINEGHHMTESSGGQSLARVLRRNAAKSPGGLARVLELTNAHVPGEGSVAEGSFDAWQAEVAGRTKRSTILYDSREAPAHLRLHVEDELAAGIAAAYAESPWVDQEVIADAALDLRTPVQDSVRFYFNGTPTNDRAWCEPRAFDALARPDVAVGDGERVALFLDCSKSEDATALVGCRYDDGHVMTLGCWQRPHGDRGRGWLAPRDEVEAEVLAAAARWDVVWFGVDPSPAKDDSDEALYWQPVLDRLHVAFRDRVALWATPGAGGSAVRFDLRMSTPGGRERVRLFTEAAELTQREIDEDGTLSHDGDPRLRVHVHNSRRLPTQFGTSLGKVTRDSGKVVDLAVAMVGARMGRRLALNSGKVKAGKVRTGGAVFF